MNLDATPVLVSIITPSLNRRDQLAGAIDCVRRQSYGRTEHIVVDGGSVDGTVEMLQETGEEVRWVSEPDDGVYSAVNKGLKLAEGDIIGYLNTDDRYFDHTVAAAVEAMTRETDVAFVYGDLLRFHTDEGKAELNIYPPFSRGYVMRGNLISQPTVFFRRSILERVGSFDESFQLAADIDLWARIADVASGLKINEVMALETFHEARLTAGHDAVARAHEELARIRSRAALVPRRDRLAGIVDSTRRRAWDRLYRIGFFWSLVGGRGAWSRFRSAPIEVDRARFLLGLLPFVGRAGRLAFDPGPLWPELREL